AQEDFLEVQDDVGDVFGDVRDGAELVLDAFHLDAGDGRALEGVQEHAAQAVAQGDAESALERLGDELCVRVGQALLIDVQPARLDQVAPILCNQCFSQFTSP